MNSCFQISPVPASPVAVPRSTLRKRIFVALPQAEARSPGFKTGLRGRCQGQVIKMPLEPPIGMLRFKSLCGFRFQLPAIACPGRQLGMAPKGETWMELVTLHRHLGLNQQPQSPLSVFAFQISAF